MSNITADGLLVVAAFTKLPILGRKYTSFKNDFQHVELANDIPKLKQLL